MNSSANSSCSSSPQRIRGGGSSSDGLSGSTSLNAGVRVSQRRKIPKKPFDPSDNYVPSQRKRRSSASLYKHTLKNRFLCNGKKSDVEGTPAQNTASGVCNVCLDRKPIESNDPILDCRDCNNKAHWSCLQSGSSVMKPRPDNTWQCPHCKTCVVCFETNDASILTVCNICCDAYHTLCHSPRIPERMTSWNLWECNNCLKSPMDLFLKALKLERSSSPAQALVGSGMGPFLKGQQLVRSWYSVAPYPKQKELDSAPSKGRDLPIDPSIPDITNWTTDDVFEYFSKHLPKAAPILKEQEFDGRSLRLLRKSDIVKGLGLALGTALKLYRIVIKLKTRRDDITMCSD